MIEEVESQSGNAQLLELYNRNDEIQGLHKLWSKTAEDIQRNACLPGKSSRICSNTPKRWARYGELKAEYEAIEAQRSLLADPDPVRPLLDRTVEPAAPSIKSQARQLPANLQVQQAQLASDTDWQKLSDAQRTELAEKHHLAALTNIDLGSPESLQDALDDCDIDHWVARYKHCLAASMLFVTPPFCC